MDIELESNNKYNNGENNNGTFWPLEHPTEPLEEDRPIICPMPYSSSLLKNNGIQEGRFSADMIRKRPDYLAPPRKSGGILEVTMEPPIRAVRKRPHPIGPDFRAANASMSQVLHQFNKFKS